MALDVTLANDGTTYRLRCNTVRIAWRRNPMIAPIPGANPILFDLGYFQVEIAAEGILPEADTTDEGIGVVPGKSTFETAVKTWGDTETLTFTVSADSYTVKIASCQFTIVAARENRWDFNLALRGFKNP